MWRAGRATEETSPGASRTTPIATHLAARQGRRRRAGRASRRSDGGRPPHRSRCPGAAAYPAPTARRCCGAAAQRARGGVLPIHPHAGGVIAGDSKGGTPWNGTAVSRRAPLLTKPGRLIVTYQLEESTPWMKSWYSDS